MSYQFCIHRILVVIDYRKLWASRLTQINHGYHHYLAFNQSWPCDTILHHRSWSTNVDLFSVVRLGTNFSHDDVIKWKDLLCYWPILREIHRLPVNSLHKGQWRGALMFSLICTWINTWVNNREAGDLRHHRAHYDVIVMNEILIDYSSFKKLHLKMWSVTWQSFCYMC